MRNNLQRFLLYQDGKYELFKWVCALIEKRGARLVWLPENDRKRMGADGYACINVLGVPAGCTLEELLPILCHEVGHWSRDRHGPGCMGIYLVAAQQKYYPVLEPIEGIKWRCDEEDEQRAWRFSERIIKFYYQIKMKGRGYDVKKYHG